MGCESRKKQKDDAGVIWYEPNNTNNHVRVMEGHPKMPQSYRRKPYTKRNQNGTYRDKDGNPVKQSSAEAHIPYEEFNYDRTTKTP
ncbi:hypothetical protein FAI40_04315 [Acetobacteraceae bacterium]|nr:hypothetical protein FAI40_04315 [Acetobacteraceae bacterium]